MELKAAFLTTVLVVCHIALTFTQPIDPLQKKPQKEDKVDLSEIPTPKLKLIGVIGSHSYFYDQGQRNWEDSRSYCRSLGMDLAELPTQAHFQLLADYADVDPDFDYNNYYWVSGRDSGKFSQFAWDSTNENIAADLPYAELAYGPNSCLFYQTGSRQLFGTPCSDSGNLVLCQTI